MNWKLYKKDNPDTYPIENVPVVLYRKYFEETYDLDVHMYDPKFNKFYRKEGKFGRWYKDYEECYYAYISLVPKAYREYNPKKCNYHSSCPHGFDDDGYCVNAEFKCEYAEEKKEYFFDFESTLWV